MKNKYKILIIIGVSLLGNSCDDFLEKNPESSFNTGTFYESEEGILLAVDGAYSCFQPICAEYLPKIAEARSDNFETGESVYDFTLISKCKDDESTEILWSAWQQYYKAITACNYVLDHIDGVEFTSDDRKSCAAGEVRFLRALAYFDLFRIWGGVPLIDHVVTDDEAKLVARASDEEMYAFLTDEFIQAGTELPAAWEDADDLGRATKYAAEGILARVYLTEKDWTSAKLLLEDVINSGLYERFANWADIWDDSNDNGKEFVFEIQFISGNIGEGNDFPDDVIPTDMSSDEVPYGGSNGHMFSSKNIYNAYEEGDTRRDLTLKKGYTTIDGNVNTGTIWVNKFCHGKVTAIADWEINWAVLRISDVYLMYAEVLNEINYSSGGDAMEILNWNRNRAGLAPLVASDVPDQDSFRSAIEEERRLEFAFENIRWFDLVRTDRAYDVINDFLEADTYPAVNDYELESYQLIFAIPQEELYRNPDENYMWQNPGY